MADLTDLQSAQTVKIAGADPVTGIEDSFAQVDTSGNLQVKNTAAGTVVPGTVATNSELIGGQFNTTLPTLTNTQQVAIQVDSSGRVLITVSDRKPAFGTVTNTSVALPKNTATLLLAANANRRYAYISNPTNSVLFIQFGSSTGLSTTQGLVIAGSTSTVGSPVFEIKGDNLYTGAIFGYSGSIITVSVTEGTP